MKTQASGRGGGPQAAAGAETGLQQISWALTTQHAIDHTKQDIQNALIIPRRDKKAICFIAGRELIWL